MGYIHDLKIFYIRGLDYDGINWHDYELKNPVAQYNLMRCFRRIRSVDHYCLRVRRDYDVIARSHDDKFYWGRWKSCLPQDTTNNALYLEEKKQKIRSLLYRIPKIKEHGPHHAAMFLNNILNKAGYS